MSNIYTPRLNEVRSDGLDRIKRHGWTVLDEPGAFLELPKVDLLIDRTYQRAADSEVKITRMAGAWSWLACGALIVAERGGRFFVVDGQHRLLAAMKRSDIDKMPCLVFSSEGVSDEAGGFLRANRDRRPMRSIQAFQAKLVAGDVFAQKANALIEMAGRSVGSGGKNLSQFSAVEALVRAVTFYENEINRIWPVLVALCHREQFSKDIILGFVEIERRLTDETLSSSRWRHRILQVGYDAIKASILKAKGYHGRAGSKIAAIGILNAINHGLRSKLNVPGLGEAA